MDSDHYLAIQLCLSIWHSEYSSHCLFQSFGSPLKIPNYLLNSFVFIFTYDKNFLVQYVNLKLNLPLVSHVTINSASFHSEEYIQFGKSVACHHNFRKHTKPFCSCIGGSREQFQYWWFTRRTPMTQKNCYTQLQNYSFVTTGYELKSAKGKR